jgi:hypothetical protein
MMFSFLDAQMCGTCSGRYIPLGIPQKKILSLKIPPGSVASGFQSLFCALPKEMAKAPGFARRKSSIHGRNPDIRNWQC